MKKYLIGIVAALFATSAFAMEYTSGHKGDWSVSSNEELTEVISENRGIAYKKGFKAGQKSNKYVVDFKGEDYYVYSDGSLKKALNQIWEKAQQQCADYPNLSSCGGQ